MPWLSTVHEPSMAFSELGTFREGPSLIFRPQSNCEPDLGPLGQQRKHSLGGVGVPPPWQWLLCLTMTLEGTQREGAQDVFLSGMALTHGIGP